MKTLTKLMVALTLCLGLLSTVRADPMPAKDGFEMVHGTMMVTRGGKTAPMLNSLKLRNGMEIRADGLVLTADGDRFRLKDGDYMAFNGTVVKASMPTATAAPAPKG